MITKQVPVDVYVEWAYCECGDMLVKNDNAVLTTYPCQYVYKCPSCGKVETSYDDYPKISYKEKEERVCD